jgi:hypothetical protein
MTENTHLGDGVYMTPEQVRQSIRKPYITITVWSRNVQDALIALSREVNKAHELQGHVPVGGVDVAFRPEDDPDMQQMAYVTQAMWKNPIS